MASDWGASGPNPAHQTLEVKAIDAKDNPRGHDASHAYRQSPHTEELSANRIVRTSPIVSECARHDHDGRWPTSQYDEDDGDRQWNGAEEQGLLDVRDSRSSIGELALAGDFSGRRDLGMPCGEEQSEGREQQAGCGEEVSVASTRESPSRRRTRMLQSRIRPAVPGAFLILGSEPSCRATVSLRASMTSSESHTNDHVSASSSLVACPNTGGHGVVGGLAKLVLELRTNSPQEAAALRSGRLK